MNTPQDTPTSCRETLAALYGLPPGAVPPPEVARHLAGCPKCGSAFAELRGMEKRLRQELAEDSPPRDLWRNIAMALDTVEAERQRRPDPQRTWRRLWVASAIAAAALLVWIGVDRADSARDLANPKHPQAIADSVNDFIAYKLSGRAPDIASNDMTAIGAWFSGKIKFPLPDIDAESTGFKLIGSRLCYLMGRNLPALIFGKGDRVVSLYVMDSKHIELPDRGGEAVSAPAARGFRFKDHDALIWRNEGLVVVAVGDVSWKDLVDFSAKLRIRARTDMAFRLDLGHLAHI